MNPPPATISARYDGVLGSFHLDVTFETPMRGVTALFGPSGCGKTMILRCVAGLNRLPGRLSVGDEVWQDDVTGKFLDPHERAVGYVFQEASLFTHLSVLGNLRYGHRRALKKQVAEEIRLDDVVDLLGIAHLLDRATGKLSGGERQRVALGRALLSQPRLLLMDEPLSALDRMTKEEILPYFEALHASLSIPALYVSHDISEIQRLADHMVFLESGRVAAAGPLNELLADTRLAISQSREASTILEARIGAYNAQDGLTVLEIAGQEFVIPRRLGREGGTERLRIAATDVSLAVGRPSETSILNIIRVRVMDVRPVDDAQVNVLLTIGHRDGGPKLLARITRRAQRLLCFTPGQDVYAQIKAASLVGSSDPHPPGRALR